MFKDGIRHIYLFCGVAVIIYLFIFIIVSFTKGFGSNRLLVGIFFGTHICKYYGGDTWLPIYESSSVWWSIRVYNHWFTLLLKMGINFILRIKYLISLLLPLTLLIMNSMD